MPRQPKPRPFSYPRQMTTAQVLAEAAVLYGGRLEWLSNDTQRAELSRRLHQLAARLPEVESEAGCFAMQYLDALALRLNADLRYPALDDLRWRTRNAPVAVAC